VRSVTNADALTRAEPPFCSATGPPAGVRPKRPNGCSARVSCSIPSAEPSTESASGSGHGRGCARSTSWSPRAPCSSPASSRSTPGTPTPSPPRGQGDAHRSLWYRALGGSQRHARPLPGAGHPGPPTGGGCERDRLRLARELRAQARQAAALLERGWLSSAAEEPAPAKVVWVRPELCLAGEHVATGRSAAGVSRPTTSRTSDRRAVPPVSGRPA